MEEPYVSVIIPSYNMGEHLDSAIRSVIEGEFESFEIVVVDDGSVDSTKDVVGRFTDPKSAHYDQRVRYIYQENAGKSVAVNRGFEDMRGQYVAILDADDQLPPNGLVDRCKPVQASEPPPPDLIIGGFEVLSGNEVVGRRPAPASDRPDALRQQFLFNYKTPFHLNSCLFARSLIHRAGKFDERLLRAQDQDYSLRLLAEAEEISVVNAVVYRYRKYRDEVADRLRYRLRNLRYRPQMIRKHTNGLERISAVGLGAILDLGKLLFETRGDYHN
jgi:glycosyltransferase involved in cell wall biosynthesis